MIPQNPGVANDPSVQLQNLQNAQQALQYFEGVTNETEQVMASLRQLEDTMGIGDIGARTYIGDLIKQAAMSTPAYNLLAQMNFVSSVENLLDSNQISSVEMIINNNISSIQSGQAGQ